MTELEHARAMIERCEAKRAAATDAGSRRYYELCAQGWRRWVERLRSESGSVS
jgi:hypothetical protein